MTLKDLSTNKQLTEQQQQFIELYCDPEVKMTLQQIADEIGVTRRTLTNWKTKPGPVQAELMKREKLRALSLLPLANRAAEDILENGSDTAKAKIIGLAWQSNGLLLKDAVEVVTKPEPKMTVEEALKKYGITSSAPKPAEKIEPAALDQPPVRFEERYTR